MDTSLQNKGNYINAEPRKHFFIDLLTRDITLSNCILDLIDNSIDGIIKVKPYNNSDFTWNTWQWQNNRYEWFYVKINLTESEFSIEDNWSWIDEKTLRDYAFRFWAGDNFEDRQYNWLWAFWIWMKRAFFKIWKNIRLETNTEDSSIIVDIDVDKRAISDDWNIEYKKESFDPNKHKRGTKIIITNLNEDIKNQVKKETYIKNSLRNPIEKSYPLFMWAWMKISVNWTVLSSTLPDIVYKDECYWFYEEKNFNNSWVDVKIIAWLIMSEGWLKTENTDNNWWFVFCNSRNVLYGNKDLNTWWWYKGLRQFHSSLNPFVWYVFLSSNDEKKLPRNTTKDWIVFDNTTYQEILEKMVKVATPVVRFLARRYEKWEVDKKWDTEIKSLFQNNVDSKSVVGLMQEVKEKNQVFSLKESRDTEKIQYNVKKEKVEKVKEYLKEEWEPSPTNRTVWLYTFDYFYKREIKD